ncbi:MAG: hypothetical protein WDO13_13775 [Verrucomicrobiota bacterium]
MNQFRDLTMVAFIVLALGLGLGHPENWTWAATGGPYVVNAVNFLSDARPWSIVVLLALALALFMTRIKY